MEWASFLGVFPIVNALILVWVACHLPAPRQRTKPDRCPITQSGKCVVFSDTSLLCAECRAKVVGRVREEARKPHG